MTQKGLQSAKRVDILFISIRSKIVEIKRSLNRPMQKHAQFRGCNLQGIAQTITVTVTVKHSICKRNSLQTS